MINYNKLFSGLFSIVLIYVVMTIFELVFFIFIVCPVITNNIHELLDFYLVGNNGTTQLDKNILLIADILNKREYKLINKLNFNSYLIIIILIFLLISCLGYLYVKIGVFDSIGVTDEITEFVSDNGSHDHHQIGNINSIDTESDPESDPIELSTEKTNNDVINASQNSNITHKNSIKKIYLRHAIVCACSTVFCLVVYQIFFYNYGLNFLYIGSKNELIVLIVNKIK